MIIDMLEVNEVDIKMLLKLIKNNEFLDIKKLQYKYPEINLYELAELLKAGFYDELPLPDFDGRNICYLKRMTESDLSAVRLLSCENAGESRYGYEAITDEIHSTMAIENISAPRDSVSNIVNGSNPSNKIEEQIYGLKNGFEYICKVDNDITEENLHTLYQLAIGDYLEGKNKLISGNYYRHDSVFLVSHKLEHTDLAHKKLSNYMGKLIKFINSDDKINDLVKAAIIHFYIGYIHPYFDGNGRIARLLHQWFLIRRGYSSTLFYSLSNHIERSCKAYYKAFTKTEENAELIEILDVTTFVRYFNDNVYAHLKKHTKKNRIFDKYNKELSDGNVTEKEKDLWNYIVTAYKSSEFSTTQLEKDFGNAAYATIRSFVLKFEKLGLLSGQRYSSKVKYKLKT